MITTLPSRTSGTPLSTYLCEIDRTPLLSANEEKQLAGRIQSGDTEARDQMILANLRLVVKIARTKIGHGVSLEDLIEEGNVGLIHAAEGFDPAMNTRFSTYAVYWIKQCMSRFTERARTLPLPAYLMQMIRDWKREGARLEERFERRPTDEEINARLQLSVRQVRNVNKALKVFASKQTETDAPELGLEKSLAGKSNGEESLMMTDELLVKVLNILNNLDKRESQVLRMRFGLQGSKPMTLKQIGARLGLTRERIRQIEKEVLVKLHGKMQDTADYEA